MTVWHIFIKSLKEQFRDWRTLGASFLLPVFFMVIFGMAFGGSYYTYKIFIRDNDRGLPDGVKLSGELINRLTSQQYEDGTGIFSRLPIPDAAETAKKLQKHEAAALITIPENFSSALAQAKAAPATAQETRSGTAPKATVSVEGDPGYPSFSLVKMIFDAILADFVMEKAGLTPPVASSTLYMGVKKKGSEFDYIAPGLMLFAIFMLIFQVSMVLVKESESGGLHRLRLTPMRPWELLLGVSLTQVVFAILMVPLMIASATMVGFNSQGSLVAGMAVGVLASFSAIAAGLIIAAFCSNATQAFIISNAVLVPVIFLSGVFFPLPNIVLFHLGNHAFTVFELQPATHAVTAFNRIFLYGAPLTELGYELIMLTGLSAVYFLAGVLLWKKFHLKTV